MIADASTKPYLIRAIHEWCVDNGYTPYLAVTVSKKTKVPKDFVKDGRIVLNASPLATNKLDMGNELITFEARFNGAVEELVVPVGQVNAIYARENGHGMAFDVDMSVLEEEADEPVSVDSGDKPATLRAISGSAEEPDAPSVAETEKNNEKTSKKPTQKKKSHLTRVK